MNHSLLAVLVFSIMHHILAHSWIDKLETSRGNVGYIRGYVGRTSTSSIDDAETYALPVEDPSSYSRSSCIASQQSSKYSSEYPMLSAYPGDTVTATYKENGHVCIEPTRQTAPNATYAGNYQWIWTGNPNENLNTLGQLLSSAGRVLGSHSFDDGKCCENIDNNIGRTRQDCHGSFVIPVGTPPGQYPIYWIWKFVKFGGASQTFYTSCFDVQVLGEEASKVDPVASVPAYIPLPTAPIIPTSAPKTVVSVGTSIDGSGKIQKDFIKKTLFNENSTSCIWVCQPIGKRDL